MPAREAIWFGAMISVSSTAVVLKMLAAAGVTHTLASRVMIGLLVVQDLAVVPMLVVLPQLGQSGGLLASLGRAIGIAALLLGAIVVLGTRLLPKLLRFVRRLGFARALSRRRNRHWSGGGLRDVAMRPLVCARRFRRRTRPQ